MSDVFSAYGGARNFVEGVKLGVSSWSELPGWVTTTYGAVQGFVYFIGIGGEYTTHVKVGFTAGNPDKRLASLQTGCPFKMTLLGFVMGCTGMERELHDVFADDRCEGEWFVYSDYVASTVERLLSTPYEDMVA